MNKIKPKHIAWSIPIAYMLHLIDEYFSDKGFHIWFSGLFKVDLSLSDFIIINSVGFVLTMLISILYSLNKMNNFIIGALGTLFFTNGFVHIAASALTSSYSPGAITGLLIYLPLGYIIFKKIFPLIPEQQRAFSVAAGILIQIIVAVVALNI